jgi:hypothetical protein
METWTIFVLPGLELRLFGHQARSQSLYRLSYTNVSIHICNFCWGNFLESDRAEHRRDREAISKQKRTVRTTLGFADSAWRSNNSTELSSPITGEWLAYLMFFSRFSSAHGRHVNMICIYIVTNVRVAWLTERHGVMDWTLDLFDTRRLHNIYDYSLQWRSCHFTQLHSTVYSAITVSQLQSTVHYNMNWILLICCPSSPRVPASNGRRSPFRILVLPPLHSHSNTLLTARSLELYPITASSGVLSGASNNWLMELLSTTNLLY